MQLGATRTEWQMADTALMLTTGSTQGLGRLILDAPSFRIQLNLKNGAGTVVASATTNLTGSYSFSGIADGSYTIEAATAKPWGGVTASDVLLYKKHIASIAPLSGIFLASGDVNSSGSLSAADVLLIKKRIASMIGSFTSGDWLFNPLPVNVSGGNVVQGFNGLVYGDANGSYQPVANKNARAVVDEGSVEIGSAAAAQGQLEIPVYAGAMNDLGSFQFTISYDAKSLSFKNITRVHPGFESVFVGSPEPGILTFVWAADENGITIAREEMFSIMFTSLATSASDISFTDSPTAAEFGDFDGNLVAPTFKSGNVGNSAGMAEGEFSVYPNPNHGLFTITSTRHDAGMVDVKVTDQVGKTVFGQKEVGFGANGSHTFDLSQLPKGIYLLTIADGIQSVVKKVVIL